MDNKHKHTQVDKKPINYFRIALEKAHRDIEMKLKHKAERDNKTTDTSEIEG